MFPADSPLNPPSPDSSQLGDAAPTASGAEQLDQRLDGNTAGGLLGEIFPFEMTTAVATCAGCGKTNPLGAVMTYAHPMGTILRCPTCDTPLIRIAHIRARFYVDLRGVRVLQIAEETATS
jgi:hypothetical protein